MEAWIHIKPSPIPTPWVDCFRLFLLTEALLLAGCGGGKGGEHPDGARIDLIALDARAASESASQDSLLSDLPDGEADSTPTRLDPAFFHKRSAETPLVSASDIYLMDEPVLYWTPDKLPSLDVTVLSTAGDRVWAGTREGLFVYDQGKDAFVPVNAPPGVAGPVNDVSYSVGDSGIVAVITAGKAWFTDTSAKEGSVVPSEGLPPLTCVAVFGDTVYLAGKAGGVWAGSLGGSDPPFTLIEETGAVQDMVVDASGKLWLATPQGVKLFHDGKLDSITASSGYLLDDDVRALALWGDTGEIFVGTAKGIALLGGALPKTLGAGKGALPNDDVLALGAAGDQLVVGHSIGASVLKEPLSGTAPFSRVDHYSGLRWLPSPNVTAVAIDSNAAVWIGTHNGISKVQWKEHTFSEKAEYFEKMLDDHFWRMDGFVSPKAWLVDQWNWSQSSVSDDDNDGLWTQMQIAAWCYAYAATGNEEFYLKARRAMDVMMLEVDVPAVNFEKAGLGYGFVARSLVRDDEGALFESKSTQSNWHLVEYDGRRYYWKDDTSSDEVTGHFFGYPLFYDLCAQTEEERNEVAAYPAAIASYIIDHGFVLLDLDGVKTTHGHWNPERIGIAVDGIDACLDAGKEKEDSFAWLQACYESWSGGGWLNSIEVLGYLVAAWHMTGDTKFLDAYEKLVYEHNYDVLAMPHAETYTITSPALMNHSDHELAMLAYSTLIRYEPDEERRKRWIEGLLFLYEWEKEERNPLWAAFVTLLAGPEYADLLPALESLREMPFDRREWLMDNTHRKDAGTWPNDRFGNPQFDRVFPYDEIPTIWWNGNLYAKKGGGGGRSVSGPLAWLLPYWAFRYAGVIAP